MSIKQHLCSMSRFPRYDHRRLLRRTVVAFNLFINGYLILRVRVVYIVDTFFQIC